MDAVTSAEPRAGANRACSAGMTAGGVTATGSAFTKCFNTFVVHFCFIGAGRLQQLCASFFANERSNCGQEKQFPQNNAATRSIASTELEKAFTNHRISHYEFRSQAL